MDENECINAEEANEQQVGAAKESLDSARFDSDIDRVWERIEKDKDIKNIFIQYRIENNHGVITGNNAELGDIHIGKQAGQKCTESRAAAIAEDKRTLCEWIANNYETYSMAFLIAGAVFDCLPYQWVQEAADKLCAMFDTESLEKGNTVARKERLEQFGAQIAHGTMNTYTGMINIEVIQWTEKRYPNRILNCMWKEFPQIRDTIILWLETYLMKTPVSMSKRTISAMSEFAGWDYYYFINDIIPLLLGRSNIISDMTVAQIVVELDEGNVNKDNTDTMLRNWSKLNNIHHLLTALLVSVKLNDRADVLQTAIDKFVTETIDAIQKHRKSQFLDYIYSFFAIGVRAFVFYRILIETIYRRIHERMTVNEKRAVCNLFLNLFAADIDSAQLKNGEDAIFIKMCFVNKDISNKLCCLWRLVWNNRYYREDFYFLLGKYVYFSGEENCKGQLRDFINLVIGQNSSEEICQDVLVKILKRGKRDAS